jgi:hypothetical protein
MESGEDVAASLSQARDQSGEANENTAVPRLEGKWLGKDHANNLGDQDELARLQGAQTNIPKTRLFHCLI